MIAHNKRRRHVVWTIVNDGLVEVVLRRRKWARRLVSRLNGKAQFRVALYLGVPR